MSNKYPLIAAAVAAAVASGYADAAGPSIATAAASTNTLVIAGSSAAAPAVTNFVENGLCGNSSNVLLVTSSGGSKNFLAFSCAVPADVVDPNGVSATIPAGTVVTVYYRTEGGSVVGAIPVAVSATNSAATGAQIKRLNLGDASCTGSNLTATCTVGGSSSTAGINDSFTTAVVPDFVQLGVTDVEPSQLVKDDYPTNYVTSVFGSASPTQMKALGTVPLMQQVFGLFVNTLNQGFSTVNLSKESAANILNGTTKDWGKVVTPSGAALTTTGHTITRINREPGSGTRTSTNIFFLNYLCGGSVSMPARSGETLNFATGDELNAVQATPGAIGYASIDNLLAGTNTSKFPNLVLASINGVAPGNLAAAAGQYDFWFEATFVPNSNTTIVPTSSPAATLSSFLQANVPDLASAPKLPDVNVIAGAGADNNPTVPLTSTGAGTGTVYVNPFTRNSNSCNLPAAVNP